MILDDNGFFYRGLFQYNKNTKDYFHNPVLAVCLTCEAEKLPLFVTVEMAIEKLIGNASVHRTLVTAQVCMTKSRQWFYLRKEDFSLPLSRSREYRFVRQIRIYAKQNGQQAVAEECASLLFDESKVARNISDEKKCNNVLFVETLSFQKSDGVSISTPVCSKWTKPGETIEYSVTVENECRTPVIVHLSAEDDGWKELKPQIKIADGSESGIQISDSDGGWLHLETSESKNVTVTISMTDTLAPGGCEKFPIHAKWKVIGNTDEKNEGDSIITLYAMRKLPHPCVIFDDDLLNEIRQKIGHADWAKAAYEKAYKASEEWSYPSIDFNNDYLFDTSHAHHARDCAIIYQISGEIRFAQKTAAFLREWSAPDGYRRLPRAGNQELVHDG